MSYAQDASITSKDYFVEGDPKRTKPKTRFLQYGFTLGGPIVQDKAHFFASVERVANDRPNTVVIPARPDLNTDATTIDRVWNTLIRFDHQINASNTWNVRWLRETSPQQNQLVSVAVVGGNLAPTLASAREESDLDQTVAASLNSALGSTRFNVVRLGWTQEDVAFANPGFNGNGRRQDQLPPTLNFQTFVDQQSAVAQARVNDAYFVEDTFSWFVPGKGGTTTSGRGPDTSTPPSASTPRTTTTAHSRSGATVPSTPQTPAPIRCAFRFASRGLWPTPRRSTSWGSLRRTSGRPATDLP